MNSAADPERILILSHGKSGSTGLYFKIKNSMEAVDGVFEPTRPEDIEPFLDSPRPLLTKAMLPEAGGILDLLLRSFDKRILLVRDPRDVLISALLYTGAYLFLWERPEAEIRAALRLLERKQAEPGAVTVMELFRTIWGEAAAGSLFESMRRIADHFLGLAEGHGFFVFHYEDFIAGHLSGLEAYLGRSLQGEADVDPGLQRVIRTRGSGSWRIWFLPEDVATFRPLVGDYMRHFGYDPEDWALSPSPQIEASHAAGYVLRVLNEKRVQEGLAPLAG